MPYNENECVKLGKYNFEIANTYSYLGTIQTNRNELGPNIEKRITNANRAYYALLPLIKSQLVLRAEKNKYLQDQWQHTEQNLGYREKILLNG